MGEKKFDEKSMKELDVIACGQTLYGLVSNGRENTGS